MKANLSARLPGVPSPLYVRVPFLTTWYTRVRNLWPYFFAVMMKDTPAEPASDTPFLS